MPSLSGLAAISALDEDDVFLVEEDGVSKKVTIAQLRAALNREIAYVEFTSLVSVTATVEASAQDVVSSGAIAYDGSRIKVEFFSPEVEVGSTAGSFVVLNLFDGSTDLGRIGLVENSATGVVGAPVYCQRYLTPSVATHTYKIVAWRVNSNGSVHGSAGGTGADLPGFIRVSAA